MGDMADLARDRDEIGRIKDFLRGKPLPGKVNPLVLRQDEFWWDIKGVEHRIDTMPYDYVLNVLCFCYEHPDLRDSFSRSPLHNKLYGIIRQSFEYAWMYKDLSK